jgi:hypothetical protein
MCTGLSPCHQDIPGLHADQQRLAVDGIHYGRRAGIDRRDRCWWGCRWAWNILEDGCASDLTLEDLVRMSGQCPGHRQSGVNEDRAGRRITAAHSNHLKALEGNGGLTAQFSEIVV